MSASFWSAVASKAQNRLGLARNALDASERAFTRYFKALATDESVPEGIPPAVPWEELEKKMKIPARAKNVRGKLNVPRERFWQTAEGEFVWARHLS